MPHITLRSDLYGITSVLDYKQRTARPICDLTQLLLRGPSSLTEAERELIATYTSYLNDCTFCQTAHTAATCLLPGGDDAVVAAVKRDLETAPVSEKMHALLRITAKVQKSGSQMTFEDAEAARQAGATDLEIHDTVLITALFCLYNRYVDGLATVTPTDPDFYQGLGRRITTRGYAVPPGGYQPFVYKK